nr:MAG TPA: hypothetical protein [Caudoviricetes sp.]
MSFSQVDCITIHSLCLPHCIPIVLLIPLTHSIQSKLQEAI